MKKRHAILLALLVGLFWWGTYAAATTHIFGALDVANAWTGIQNFVNGFRINNAAPSGHVPRGNGTDYVDSQLACGDLSNAGAGCSSAGGVTSLTSPLVLTGSAGSCPTCLTGANPTIVGGIMGGWYNGIGGVQYMGPWNSAGNSAGQKVPMPFSASFRNLSVVTSTAQSACGYYAFYFRVYNGGSTVFQPENPGSLTIPNGVAAGSYGSPAGTRPIFISQFLGGAGYWEGVSCGTMAAVRGYSWDIIGSSSQPLGWFANAAGVGSSSTVYSGPSQPVSVAITTEALQAVVVPYASTARNLCIATSAAQSSNNSLVLTMRQNGTTDTTLTVTIPLSGGAGVYCDTTHSVSLNAGDWITWKLLNNANATSATIIAVVIELVPSGTATGMIVFPTQGLSFSSGSAQYAVPFTAVALSATEGNQRAPMPRAVTMKNLSCIYTTPPGSNAVAVTVMQNGSPSALTVSIPTTGAGTQIVTDSVHSVSFAALDTFDLKFLQSSGTNPVISSCSVEVD
jgi:hypothetical protein